MEESSLLSARLADLDLSAMTLHLEVHQPEAEVVAVVTCRHRHLGEMKTVSTVQVHPVCNHSHPGLLDVAAVALQEDQVRQEAVVVAAVETIHQDRSTDLVVAENEPQECQDLHHQSLCENAEEDHPVVVLAVLEPKLVSEVMEEASP